MAIEVPIITGEQRLCVSRRRENLLPPRLDNKPFTERMTAQDEEELADVMCCSWVDMLSTIELSRAEVVSIGDYIDRGDYSPEALRLDWNERGEQLLQRLRDEGNPLFAMMRTQSLIEAFLAGAIARTSGANHVLLALGDVPFQKNEKETRNPKRHFVLESPLYRQIPSIVYSDSLDGVILVDGHSGVSSLEFLRWGVAVADLTAAPALISRALQEGLLDGRLCNVVTDTGAMNYGLYIAEHLDIEEGIQTGKNSTEDTPLLYPKEEWEVVRGRDVVLLDDRLMTFGTGSEPIEKALQHGATSAVFLVTYPECSGPAIERFRKLRDGSGGRVHVVTTDLFIPKDDHGNTIDITHEPNIHIVPLQDRLVDILQLTKQGVDILDYNNRGLLLPLGFERAPWMRYNHGKS